MKKKKKIYGVYGLMEYQAVVKVGRATMKVPFSNGSMTAMGVNPATYSTSDFITQQAIEHSPIFKSGQIKLVREIELDEDLPIMGRVAVAASAPVEEVKPEPQEPQSEKPAELDGEAKKLERVEFSCNDDAKDYLEEHFGVTRSKLLNREAIKKAGEAYGVEIAFTNE